MKVLLSKTFIKMFKIVPVTVIIIISALMGFLFSYIYGTLAKDMLTFSRLSSNAMNVYSLFAFMIMAGLIIWIIASNSSSGLFASEMHEGTMRLLMSKEITRIQLVMGKILGMLLGSLIYLIASFATFLMIFCLFSGVEKDVLMLLLKGTAIFILYGAVIIFILGGIGTFLSTVFKKKVPAVLILVALGALIFGIIPIIRVILSSLGYYNRFNLQFIDINYHFGLIFNNFLQVLGNFASSQSQSSIFTVFTNLYTQAPIDVDITLATSSYYIVNTSLNGIMVMFVYLAGATGLYALSFRTMLKKDI